MEYLRWRLLGLTLFRVAPVFNLVQCKATGTSRTKLRRHGLFLLPGLPLLL